MSNIIDGIRQNGNTENDFINIMDSDNMIMKMGDKIRVEESYHINKHSARKRMFYTDTNADSKI